MDREKLKTYSMYTDMKFLVPVGEINIFISEDVKSFRKAHKKSKESQ
jgi:hypothetical protein